ncbi:hypothetical protein TVAG_364440 [Trichomonas vaginalis G3]|uniref:Uncharacterized protein n=1 Tax=Trichomonas vaginalis (strain ATCC PRA-98 / G3) TaxID=412133 RepID=A2E9F5_TRIV3|nr:hypothetical protein TVAGG3_0000970 [Trichomonas vaginalis G3]EAY10719.1 hypothetical protein TVAG_364440 [Trichomonas vaginalis G3]KAI5538612.1 hypothetical protein TVAGG3_0000970 [Trichomonas vaginalis G3]|eukprot:XP_001322942.1 hypothetical protein [Trichomonas vaginalis G3]
MDQSSSTDEILKKLEVAESMLDEWENRIKIEELELEKLEEKNETLKQKSKECEQASKSCGEILSRDIENYGKNLKISDFMKLIQEIDEIIQEIDSKIDLKYRPHVLISVELKKIEKEYKQILDRVKSANK